MINFVKVKTFVEIEQCIGNNNAIIQYADLIITECYITYIVYILHTRTQTNRAHRVNVAERSTHTHTYTHNTLRARFTNPFIRDTHSLYGSLEKLYYI